MICDGCGEIVAAYCHGSLCDSCCAEAGCDRDYWLDDDDYDRDE